MISRYKQGEVLWIDIESPTSAEIATIKDEFKIPNSIVGELINKTYRSKVDNFGSIIYTILHFPSFDEKTNKKTEKEIDFILGKNFIITVHYEMISSIYEFAKFFEMNAFLNNESSINHSGYVFYNLIKRLYDEVVLELDEINFRLEKIEQNIFDNREGEMVEVISNMNRSLLDFKQAIRFHREIFKSLDNSSRDLYGDSFSYYITSIIGDYSKVEGLLDGNKEILKDLKETNDSLLTHKTNEIIKVLTVMNFIILPLTLIAGIFGMNMNFVFIHTMKDFAIIVGGMIGLILIMLMYFKFKKWL